MYIYKLKFFVWMKTEPGWENATSETDTTESCKDACNKFIL